MQLDIDDLLMDPRWIGMTCAARGAYIQLLAHQWRQGYLPDDLKLLQKISGTNNREWKRIWSEIGERFDGLGSGKLINRRCEKDRNRAMSRKLSLSERGRKGAEVKHSGHATAMQRPVAEACNGLGNEKVKVKEKVKGTSEVECSTEKNLANKPPPNSELPSGGTMFDYADQIKALEARYRDTGHGAEQFDKNELRDFMGVVGEIAPKPRQRLGLLMALKPFNLVQIAIALDGWAALTDPPRQPAPYFTGMVRNAGGKAAKMLDDYDRQQEKRRQRDAATQQAQPPQDTPTAHRSRPAGFHTVGDVLRNLPEVRRPPGGEPDTRTHETDNGNG
jgi:uncharacterized protein YdaU (DUF1376 family)